MTPPLTAKEAQAHLSEINRNPACGPVSYLDLIAMLLIELLAQGEKR